MDIHRQKIQVEQAIRLFFEKVNTLLILHMNFIKFDKWS
jgi:hypothetical protein